MSADVSDFEVEVISRSRSVPVLVDFWAPWCGPCKMLKPVLEKLAVEAAGRWELVKVNTDENQALAAQHGIRGIPDVKLFYGGGVVAEFSGAMPEYALRKWLDENLPPPVRVVPEPARERILAGDFVGAEALVGPLYAAAPGDASLMALLALARVFRDPAGALALVGGRSGDEVEQVRLFAHVLALKPEVLPDSPAKLPLLGGLAELRAGRFAEALRLLIASMEESARYADAAAKRTCTAIFKLLGPRHPVSEEFQRQFNSVANS